jgi:hypothetical protein
VTIIVAEAVAIMGVVTAAAIAIEAYDLKMGAKAPIFITSIDSFYPG